MIKESFRAPTKEESEEMRRLLDIPSNRTPAEKLHIILCLYENGYLTKIPWYKKIIRKIFSWNLNIDYWFTSYWLYS